MRVAEAVDHELTASADAGHIDVPVAVDDAELGAALEEGGDFGGVDDVFAGEAGDVGTGSTDTFVFDVGDVLALRAEGPGEIFSCLSAADDECVVLFWGGHMNLPNHRSMKRQNGCNDLMNSEEQLR